MSAGSSFTHTAMNGWYIAAIIAAQKMITTIERRFMRMKSRKLSSFVSV